MSTTLWKIDPQKFCTPAPEDLDLILVTAYNSDDGSYYLDHDHLSSLKGRISYGTYLALEREIDANGSINFIIGS